MTESWGIPVVDGKMRFTRRSLNRWPLVATRVTSIRPRCSWRPWVRFVNVLWIQQVNNIRQTDVIIGSQVFFLKVWQFCEHRNCGVFSFKNPFSPCETYSSTSPIVDHPCYTISAPAAAAAMPEPASISCKSRLCVTSKWFHLIFGLWRLPPVEMVVLSPIAEILLDRPPKGMWYPVCLAALESIVEVHLSRIWFASQSRWKQQIRRGEGHLCRPVYLGRVLWPIDPSAFLSWLVSKVINCVAVIMGLYDS